MDTGRHAVIVGVGAVCRRPGAPDREAATLMSEAVRAALADAAPATPLTVDQVIVARGTWSYRDPGALIAAACGLGRPRTVVAELGVLQTSLVARAVDDVMSGRSVCTVVVGGEARRRAGDRARDGLDAGEVEQGGDGPDEVMAPGELVISRLEIDAGLVQAVQHYALLERAYAAAAGRSPADRRAEVDDLWRRYALAAADNPLAWEPAGAAALAADGWGRPLAAPYLARHVTQWNVDQAAAVVITSVAAARAAGVEPSACAHPAVVVGSDHVVPVTERAALHRCEAMAAVGATLTAAGHDPGGIDHVELYSCFPVAVSVQCDELGLSAVPPSLTGGMTFGGGPFNNSVLMSLERVVHAVRASTGTGLVTGLSGMLTKQGAVVVGPGAPGAPCALVDVTAAAATTGRVAAVSPAEAVGPARIVSSTVLWGRAGAERAVAVVDTAAGRSLVSSALPEVMDALADEPMVGTAAVVRADGTFEPA